MVGYDFGCMLFKNQLSDVYQGYVVHVTFLTRMMASIIFGLKLSEELSFMVLVSFVWLIFYPN